MKINLVEDRHEANKQHLKYSQSLPIAVKYLITYKM